METIGSCRNAAHFLNLKNRTELVVKNYGYRLVDSEVGQGFVKWTLHHQCGSLIMKWVYMGDRYSITFDGYLSSEMEMIFGKSR